MWQSLTSFRRKFLAWILNRPWNIWPDLSTEQVWMYSDRACFGIPRSGRLKRTADHVPGPAAANQGAPPARGAYHCAAPDWPIRPRSSPSATRVLTSASGRNDDPKVQLANCLASPRLPFSSLPPFCTSSSPIPFPLSPRTHWRSVSFLLIRHHELHELAEPGSRLQGQ